MPDRLQRPDPLALARAEALALGAEHGPPLADPRRRSGAFRAARRAWCAALRLTHHEFWPTPLFLLPLFPWILWLGVRHGGLRVCTCANPGIPSGGGVLGESKSQILDGLNDAAEHVLPAKLVEAGPPPEQRARNAARIIEGEPELGGYPIVLKPDAGERGYGVAIIRSSNELEPYFRRIDGPVLCQKYDPGPCEFGVFWIRETEAINDESVSPAGRIFSVTRKRFPIIEGDGLHTLEELIFRHKRFRKQSKLLLLRHRGRLGWIPAEGEIVRLGHAGNHAQGAIFSDGGDLVTPELSTKIDEIARSFRGVGGGVLDFGRLDLRCPSEDDLRAGRHLAIIEVNGVFSESTNLYDPDRSALWAYRVLFGQWKRLYEVGAARKRAGATPIGAAELLRTIIEHRRSQRTLWTGA